MRNSNRRGMLLLVVLALLAMFAMVTVAFVVLTGSEKVSAIRVQQIDFNQDSPQKTLEQAVKVVVNGVPIDPAQVVQPTSAITWQSLLEKIYGFETIGSLANFPNQACVLNGATPVCGGQLIEFTLPTSNPDTTYFGGAAVDPFHTVGCVVTMLDGPAAGLSTRIVGVNPTNSSPNVQMLAFEGGVKPVNGNHYIVNGFPYSGMGFGFSNGALAATALTPNAPPSAWGGTKGIVPGGANSDYTAPDYQDPLLAMAAPIPNVAGGVVVPIPSLHRADLIKYAGGPTPQNMFRPASTATFTGSNPNFNPTWDGITAGQGRWDVDNMGTGTPDSVWVDLGQAVKYTTDGRAYKPLFAVLCLDMDGRLNVNAHGNFAQTNSNYAAPQNLTNYQPLSKLDLGPYGATGGQGYYAGPVGSQLTTPPVALMRGQGTGPAEVNLLPLFRDPSNASNFLYPMYQALLTGNSSGPIPLMGRYGGGNAMPGVDNQGSALTINYSFPYSGVTGGYWTNSGTTPDAYGSPPDPQGMGAVAIDTAGRGLYVSMGGQVVNGPYDTDLTRNAPHAVDIAPVDSPFGAAEMERILRFGDRDAALLPQRLFNLTATGNGSVLVGRRAEFTVESNMVPVSAAVLPPALRSNLPNKRSTHPIDILIANGASTSVAAQLLPWEVIEGLKMDINRPFGAGAYSTNGSINTVYGGSSKIEPDQPGTMGETVQQYVAAGAGQSAAQFNYSADAGAFSQVNNSAVNDSMAARQLYARHLYVLMLLLADNGAVRTNWFGGNDDAMKRMFAQWAVNVVAYRDHNGIMIPFQYDTFPSGVSGGWHPANDVAHTVWGCKRPDLLITETLAFHDRRTQDLPDEKVDPAKPGTGPNGTPPDPNRTDGGLTTSTDPKSKDPSFNSGYRPQGSLFVELYNPWPLMEPRTPDLGSPNTPGVELTKVTPAGGMLQPSPVWRMIIVDPSKNSPSGGDELPDPDNPTVGSRPTIERVVYFVPSAMASNAPNDGQVSYHPSAATQWPKPNGLFVAPGGYAVIGSGDPNQQNHTFIGFENGKTVGSTGTTRMVTMNQGDLAGDARVVKNTNDPPVMANPPQVMGIDAPQRLSISEPAKGYTGYERNGQQVQIGVDATGKYLETLDIPVDEQRFLFGNDPDKTFGATPLWASDPGAVSILNNDNTTPSYRIIYLQRLADPTRPYVSDTNAAADPRTWNPYRTVDAMTVDLTAFNGMTTNKDPTTHTGTFYFESRQRGEKNYMPGSAPAAAGAVGEANLWKQEPALKGLPLPSPGLNWVAAGWTGGGTPPSSATMNFQQPLNQSFGYLNKQFYGQPSANPASPGDPQYPFPWLNWSYRPFNNAYELLLVPTVSSSRLLARTATTPGNPQARQYYGYVDGSVRSITDGGGTYTPMQMYDYTVPTATAPVPVPYPYLLNFFESNKSSSAGASAQLSRLFAYVGVPSRFANAQLQMQAVNASSGGTHYFHTPYNRISRYREPGNINLNTISSQDVFFGMLNAYCTPLQQNAQVNPAFWDKFVRSRRGPDSGITAATNTAATFNSMFQITGAGPSRFMRPFRTPGGAYLVPPSSSGTSNEPARETDVSLLRGDPDGNNRPLFEVDDYLMNSPSSTPPISTLNVTPGASPDQFPLACMDFNRSPYFRYQLMQKVGSVASTHSNVFAIWITVGYFEVTPVTASAASPDGWQLGAELGSDTGDINRHRAFYIFDRSIPVGFVRGQDINSDKAFLLKRYIE